MYGYLPVQDKLVNSIEFVNNDTRVAVNSLIIVVFTGNFTSLVSDILVTRNNDIILRFWCFFSYDFAIMSMQNEK